MLAAGSSLAWEAYLATDEKKPDGIYRRQFLRCGLTGSLTALAALAVRPAQAQFAKATKEQASYQDPVTSQTCGQCTLFLGPDQCKVVEGPVSETGTCIYFAQ
jgi:hypothetical protein